jgi:hypothetical protein
MWIPRTEQDFAVERARKAKASLLYCWLRVFGAAAFLAIILFSPYSGGGRSNRRPRRAFVEWQDLQNSGFALEVLAIFLVVCGIAALPVWQGLLARRAQREMVCLQCSAVKFDDGNLRCPCGGRFVDGATVKWVD